MTYYHRLGQLPHKRHTQFRQPDGSLYHEELMGIHGFAGAQSLVYHLRPPTAIQRMEAMQSAQIAYEERGRCVTAIFEASTRRRAATLSKHACR